MQEVKVADVLQRFCNREDGKYMMTSPWFCEGYTYATNGRICCRIIGQHVPPPEKPDSAKGYTPKPTPADKLPQWKEFAAADWKPAPQTVEIPDEKCKNCHGEGKVHMCPECKGEGYVEWEGTYSMHIYSADCYFCEGEGTIQKNEHPQADSAGQECCWCHGAGHAVNHDSDEKLCGVLVGLWLYAIAATLPNLEIAALAGGKDHPGYLIFRSGEYEGIIVGKQKS